MSCQIDNISSRSTVYMTTATKEPAKRMCCQDGNRVGSSLDVHDCISFRLGAARACELDEVNKWRQTVSVKHRVSCGDSRSARARSPPGVLPSLDYFPRSRHRGWWRWLPPARWNACRHADMVYWGRASEGRLSPDTVTHLRRTNHRLSQISSFAFTIIMRCPFLVGTSLRVRTDEFSLLIDGLRLLTSEAWAWC